ncbi:MAG: hypothetical protein WCJ56_01030 [bacterium]
MPTPDRVRKLQIVLIAALYGLVGFFLQAGPVGGVFSLLNGGRPVFSGMGILLSACSFLAFLAVACSAAIGLHLGEEEEKPGEPEKDPTTSIEDTPGENIRARIRPELHQLRMIITALGGYMALQAISLTVLHLRDGIETGVLVALFNFGLYYTAIGWFLLWQFLRWYAQEKKWLRLQDELIGMDAVRLVAVVLAIQPLGFLLVLPVKIATTPSLLLSLTSISFGVLLLAAVVLWQSRRATMRLTALMLASFGVTLVLLTFAVGFVEMAMIGR